MEVIFGCEEVMSYSLQEIIAYQSALAAVQSYD